MISSDSPSSDVRFTSHNFEINAQRYSVILLKATRKCRQFFFLPLPSLLFQRLWECYERLTNILQLHLGEWIMHKANGNKFSFILEPFSIECNYKANFPSIPSEIHRETCVMSSTSPRTAFFNSNEFFITRLWIFALQNMEMRLKTLPTAPGEIFQINFTTSFVTVGALRDFHCFFLCGMMKAWQ